jgi:predicted MPP superfamily phosphohydrolase
MKKSSKETTFLMLLVLLISSIPLLIQTSQATNTDNNTFSVMQISDTQHLATVSPTLYNDTTAWIVNNSATYNLKMVIHTGDFIDAFYAPPVTAYNATQKDQEWAVANASMGKLLAADIPYCWCAGNHDQTPYGNSSGTIGSGINYLAFNTTYMQSKPYWVSDIFGSKNTAVKFSVSNYKFLVINIENLANSSAIDWMKNLLDRNTDSNVIVATHDYLYPDGSYDNATVAVSNWTQGLKTTLDAYPNVFLALSGHNHGYNMTNSGNRNEVLFDLQDADNYTGAAAVRIYTFNLINKQVNATTYCLNTKTWLTDTYSQFSFNITLQQIVTPSPIPTSIPTSTPTTPTIPPVTSKPTQTITPTPRPTQNPTPTPTPTALPNPTSMPSATPAHTPSPTATNPEFSLSTNIIYALAAFVIVILIVAGALQLVKRR